MTGTDRIAPGSRRWRLLKTEPDDVAPEARDALRSFCADAPEVEAGYVCRVEVTRPGAAPTQRLSFGVRLTTPVTQPGDGRATLSALVDRLASEHPAIAGTVGLGVLADHAVPAWEAKAVVVFAREEPS